MVLRLSASIFCLRVQRIRRKLKLQLSLDVGRLDVSFWEDDES